MVPIVDIDPFVNVNAHDEEARRIVASEWDMAMTHVGFAIIVGHGVDPNIISELRWPSWGIYPLHMDAERVASPFTDASSASAS